MTVLSLSVHISCFNNDCKSFFAHSALQEFGTMCHSFVSVDRTRVFAAPPLRSSAVEALAMTRNYEWREKGGRARRNELPALPASSHKHEVVL